MVPPTGLALEDEVNVGEASYHSLRLLMRNFCITWRAFQAAMPPTGLPLEHEVGVGEAGLPAPLCLLREPSEILVSASSSRVINTTVTVAALVLITILVITIRNLPHPVG
jgi:hypothetical protein